MVHLSKLVTDVRFDLDDYARDDFFRAYTTDLSLLMAMKDFSLKQRIVENTLEGNIGVDEDGIITLPLYMVAFI